MNETRAVAKPSGSLIVAMAAKHNMEPDLFARTVRSTVMPSKHTNEQFAALMMVANEYDLNPLLKEIYAFPAKGGGIVPIVSIDGWVNLVNSHPACDGFEFEFEHDDKGNPVSCTCRMHRKDRKHPVTVTEYLVECIRPTEPWKMKHRMLRHKAMIQAARYAFGFSGIYDEDEGAKIANAEYEVIDHTPPAPPSPPEEPEDGGEEGSDSEGAGMEPPATGATSQFDLSLLDGDMAGASTEEQLEGVWDAYDLPSALTHDEEELERAFEIKQRHMHRIENTFPGDR